MKRRIFILFSLLPVCLPSCIKSDVPPCPPVAEPAYYLFLAVGDRNYQNDTLSSDQFMPYADYIDNHFHVWRNLVTGEVTKGEDPDQAGGSSKRYPVSIEGIPQVPHHFTSWGNISGIDAITIPGGSATRAGEDAEAVTIVELHPDGTESTDVYLASYPVDLTPGSEQAYMMPMKRTKGLLSVIPDRFPDDIVRVDVSFGPVYSHVDSEDNYSGSTMVAKSFNLSPTTPPAAHSHRAPDSIYGPAMDILMAPNVPGTSSTLTASLYREGDTEPHIVLPAKDVVTIQDNTITPVEVRYDNELGEWQLWVTVDGAWTMVYYLTI